MSERKTKTLEPPIKRSSPVPVDVQHVEGGLLQIGATRPRRWLDLLTASWWTYSEWNLWTAHRSTICSGSVRTLVISCSRRSSENLPRTARTRPSLPPHFGALVRVENCSFSKLTRKLKAALLGGAKSFVRKLHSSLGVMGLGCGQCDRTSGTDLRGKKTSREIASEKLKVKQNG